MANLANLIVRGISRLGNVFASKVTADSFVGTATKTEFIRGTQTAATGAWTGVTEDEELYDGKEILYFLPFNGSGNATLNLTLAGGGTTGAKNCYFSSTTRLTTHYGQYSLVRMTYHKAFVIGSTTYEGWWTEPGRDTNDNTTWQLRYYGAVKAATAITADHLIVGTHAGYKNLAANVEFDLSYPILWADEAISAGSTKTTTYEAMQNVNLATTASGWTGTQYSEAYLVLSSVKGNIATIDPNIFTTAQPTEEDGKFYIPLGLMITTTNCIFHAKHELYQFKNGRFRQVVGHAVPLESKQYPSYTISANDEANACLYFAKVTLHNPTVWNSTWHVKYRLTVSSTDANVHGIYDVDYYVNGSTVNYRAFNGFYSTSYRPIYHHRILFPKSGHSDQGAYLGARVWSAYEVTSIPRIFKVEILETDGCEVEILDTIQKQSDVINTTYYYIGDYTATSTGLQETGDANDGMYYLRPYTIIAESAITGGNLIVGTDAGYKHLKLGTAFDIRYPIMYAGSNISAGGTGTNNYIFHYAIGIATTQSITLTPYLPVYIKGSLDGTSFTPASTAPLTVDVPTVADGYVYMYLGRAYNAGSMTLESEHDLYMFIGGKFQRIAGTDEAYVLVHATLTASGWSGDASTGYTQSIVAPGVTTDEECHPQIQLEHLASVTKATWESQCDAYNEFCITSWAETGAATITFHTYSAPAIDLPILVYGAEYTSNESTVSGPGTVSVVQTNVNSESTIPSSKVVYDVSQEVNTLSSSVSDLSAGTVGVLTPATNVTMGNIHSLETAGPFVAINCYVTTSTSFASNTNIATVEAAFRPASGNRYLNAYASISNASGGGQFYSAYINPSGQIKNSGTWPAGTYSINGMFGKHMN